MKNTFLFLFGIFLLFGCSKATTILSSAPATDSFSIGKTTWGLHLPEGWQKILSLQTDEAIFVASKGSENFVILQKKGDPKSFSDTLFKDAKQKLYIFEAGAVEPDRWEFTAKEFASDPLKHFIQKVFPIPDTKFFLVGSCSTDTAEQSLSQCKELIDSWGILVDQAKK